MQRTHVFRVFTLNLPTSTSSGPIDTAIIPIATGSSTATSGALIPFPESNLFPTRAVVAASVSAAVFLTVLVVAAAFVASYRMRLKFRKFEMLQRDPSVRDSLDQPTAQEIVEEIKADNTECVQMLDGTGEESHESRQSGSNDSITAEHHHNGE